MNKNFSNRNGQPLRDRPRRAAANGEFEKFVKATGYFSVAEGIV